MRQLEQRQLLSQQGASNELTEDQEEFPSVHDAEFGTALVIPVQTSTPTPKEAKTVDEASLTRLETSLMIALDSRTPLPELLSCANSSIEAPAASFPQTDEDNTSCVNNVAALPGGENKVRFLDDCTDGEETGDDSSQVNCAILYGSLHAQSPN